MEPKLKLLLLLVMRQAGVRLEKETGEKKRDVAHSRLSDTPTTPKVPNRCNSRKNET
uniref:Uncharacterized protein n=1 Tax=Oryza sativa subsp. japonica TaxID=39947 RepID=Q2QYK5_ORYSJ|nr:hypothetical protein LOC_Os12g02360 [Oryza sativa Japonica Group]